MILSFGLSLTKHFSSLRHSYSVPGFAVVWITFITSLFSFEISLGSSLFISPEMACKQVDFMVSELVEVSLSPKYSSRFLMSFGLR